MQPSLKPFPATASVSESTSAQAPWQRNTVNETQPKGFSHTGGSTTCTGRNTAALDGSTAQTPLPAGSSKNRSVVRSVIIPGLQNFWTEVQNKNYTFLTEKKKPNSPNREQSRDTSSSCIVTVSQELFMPPKPQILARVRSKLPPNGASGRTRDNVFMSKKKLLCKNSQNPADRNLNEDFVSVAQQWRFLQRAKTIDHGVMFL